MKDALKLKVEKRLHKDTIKNDEVRETLAALPKETALWVLKLHRLEIIIEELEKDYEERIADLEYRMGPVGI